MDTIHQSLLILMAAVWIVAIVLRPLLGPTVMGKLIGRKLVVMAVTNQ